MWSAEAAALMIVGIRTGRFWFRVGGLVLFAIATGVWLQSIPPEREGPFMLLLNARALAGLSVIGLLYLVGSAQKAAAGEEGNAPYERAVVLVGAHALTVVWLSLEITSFWEARGATTIGADFGREVTLSSIWAIYAAALIAVGMRRHYAPIRYFAMALFGLTLLKVVFVDSQALDGIHRVLAYLVVGALMLGVSFLYWRMKDALEPGDSTAEP